MDTLEQTHQVLTNLESALDLADEYFATAGDAVNRLASTVKTCRKALAAGDLKGFRRAMGMLKEQSARVQELCGLAAEAWPFSEAQEEDYFASSYKTELLERARQNGLVITDQEGLLACYPSLLRVSPKERAVLIDRKLSRETRPSRLVQRLRDNQQKSSKLPKDFLSSLYQTYQEITGKPRGEIARLLDVYDRWTRRPGSKKEYSVQEFTRSIYELDKSERGPDDPPFRLHAGATASKNRSNLLVMSTREGLERTYYGIEFL